MTIAQTPSAARQWLAQYFDEHLAAPPSADLAPVAVAVRFMQFRVGPFQFVLQAAAVSDGIRWPERALRISGHALVPARYRDTLDLSAITGPDLIALKGGRIEIAGCLRCGELEVPATAIRTRGLRPDTPWLMGSLRQPPSFVLDPDALQLHFGRRA